MRIESDHGAPQRRPAWRAGLRRVVLALVAALLATAGMTTMGAAPAASAADWSGVPWAHAYGRYITYTDGETIWRGSVWIDGQQAYCLEPRWHAPSAGAAVSVDLWQPGTFYAEGDSNSGLVVSAAQAQAINWLVANYGQIPDDQNALNVASAIRTFLHEADGNGDAPGTNLYRNAQAYLDLLRGYVPPAVPAASQQVGLAIATDPGDAALGTLSVTSVPITTIPVTITLTNGVFAATGAGSITLPSLAPGLELPILGTPPGTDGAPYRVRAELFGSATVASAAPPETLLVATHDAVHQQLVLPQPPPAVAVALRGAVEDADPRPSGFFPTVTTEVVRTTAAAGEPFRDTVTVTAGANDAGMVNAWPRDPDSGAYLPVVVECAVYGPFAVPPPRGPVVPADAPLAASFTVVTGDAGPDTSYEGVSSEPLTAAGSYTAVCTVDSARQPAVSAVSAGYAFTSEFGDPAETMTVIPAAELAATGLATAPTGSLLLGLSLGLDGLLLALVGRRLRRRGRFEGGVSRVTLRRAAP